MALPPPQDRGRARARGQRRERNAERAGGIHGISGGGATVRQDEVATVRSAQNNRRNMQWAAARVRYRHVLSGAGRALCDRRKGETSTTRKQRAMSMEPM